MSCKGYISFLQCLERYSSWLVRSQISPAAKSMSCPGTPLKRGFAAAPPPPPPAEPAAQESFLNGTSGAYVEEMFEAWSLDPKSVHVSWDAYFRGGAYQVSVKVKGFKFFKFNPSHSIY